MTTAIVFPSQGKVDYREIGNLLSQITKNCTIYKDIPLPIETQRFCKKNLQKMSLGCQKVHYLKQNFYSEKRRISYGYGVFARSVVGYQETTGTYDAKRSFKDSVVVVGYQEPKL